MNNVESGRWSPDHDVHPSNIREKISLDDNGSIAFLADDQENPKSWPIKKKLYCTFIAILLVLNATMSSSAPTGAIQGIADEFNVSIEVAGLVTTVFLLGYVAGPLQWAPLSELYGRRWIFYISFTTYLAFNFLCAFTPNFPGLLVGRFLTGVAASAALSNAPGVIADIWGPVGRGNAMVLFITATFIGPALGPVIAGFLQLTKNWRWVFYVLIWLAAITEVLVLSLPETLPSIVLLRKVRKLRQTFQLSAETIQAPFEKTDRRLKHIFKVALTRPWKLLFDPISFFVAIYYCVTYSLLYMLFSIYPIVFQQKRGWNAGVGELPLIGTIVGACIGGAMLFYLSKRERRIIDGGRKIVPEDRLLAAMGGGVLFAISLFWFSWAAEFNSIHWIVPTLAGTFLATSILLIFASFINYFVDCYLTFAASAVAANTIVRSACAAATPLFTQYMFDALGVGGGGSLIGGIAVLLAPMPFVFFKYGAQIRRRSKYAITDAL